jgi:flagellar biosynthesis protein
MEKAVALEYRDDLPAPIIVAKGRGVLAERILRIAEENGVTILEKGSLADRLYAFDPGNVIPEDLYAVVAEVYAFLISIDEAQK